MILRRLVLGIYLATLLTATHWPKLVVNPASGARLDLIIHFGAFGLLTVLVAWAGLFDRDWMRTRNLIPSAITTLALAGFDEITQTIAVFGRVTDVLDYAADGVGIILATLAVVMLRGLVSRKKD